MPTVKVKQPTFKELISSDWINLSELNRRRFLMQLRDRLQAQDDGLTDGGYYPKVTRSSSLSDAELVMDIFQRRGGRWNLFLYNRGDDKFACRCNLPLVDQSPVSFLSGNIVEVIARTMFYVMKRTENGNGTS